MPLVGRRVPDVATGGGQHVAAGEVQRRGELLVGGVLGDLHGPAPARLPAARHGELVDQAVRRRGVDVAPVRVGHRRGVGDPRAALPASDPLRNELPQALAGARLDRERAPVGRRYEEHVAPLPLHAHGVEVDRRAVDRAREAHLPPLESADAAQQRARRVVGALGVVAEAGPVVPGAGGLRAAGGALVGGGIARAAAAGERRGCEQEWQQAAHAHQRQCGNRRQRAPDTRRNISSAASESSSPCSRASESQVLK